MYPKKVNVPPGRNAAKLDRKISSMVPASKLFNGALHTTKSKPSPTFSSWAGALWILIRSRAAENMGSSRTVLLRY